MEKAPLVAHSAFRSAASKLKGFKGSFWLLAIIIAAISITLACIQKTLMLNGAWGQKNFLIFMLIYIGSYYFNKLLGTLPLSLTLNYAKGGKAHWKNIHPMNEPRTWLKIIFFISLVMVTIGALIFISIMMLIHDIPADQRHYAMLNHDLIGALINSPGFIFFAIGTVLLSLFILAPIFLFSLVQILEGQPVIQSIKTATQLWQGEKLSCAIAMFYIYPLIIFSALTLGIALIWTLPLSNLYVVELYLSCKRKLKADLEHTPKPY